MLKWDISFDFFGLTIYLMGSYLTFMKIFKITRMYLGKPKIPYFSHFELVVAFSLLFLAVISFGFEKHPNAI